MKSKKTKEQFIADAIKVHGDKYDYSKVNYQGCNVKVEIICPKHGSFWQTPTKHLNGGGCAKCHYEDYAKKKRKTTEQFIKEAKAIHGDKYNYDKTKYINKRSKVCITCPIHGDFWQNAQSHLNGCGCKECMKEKFRITYENFIERAKHIHGDKFDYSLITKENFKGVTSYVDIICPIHGVFRQNAVNHLNGKGCPQCAYDSLRKTNVMPKEELLNRVNKLYGDRFDMSKAVFVNVNTPFTVVCKEHGDFNVKPRYFLRGFGCPQCDGFGKYSTEHFIELARQKHGDKYDYSNVDYKLSREPVEIICKTCGKHFFQSTNSHLQGCGCPDCAIKEQSLVKRHTTEIFIEKARKVHGDRYSYEHTEYIKDNMPVTITCDKHGDFQQIANAHLQGCGCPRCSISRGEEKIMIYLNKNGIEYTTQYKINNENLFCDNKSMYLDFYIPSLNMAIEYQGEQHYHPTGFVNNEERFVHQQERDNAVRQYCKEHGIRLVEIPYTEFNNIESILNKDIKLKTH